MTTRMCIFGLPYLSVCSSSEAIHLARESAHRGQLALQALLLSTAAAQKSKEKNAAQLKADAESAIYNAARHPASARVLTNATCSFNLVSSNMRRNEIFGKF